MKKIFVMLLAVVMTVMSVGATTAFAAEATHVDDMINVSEAEENVARYSYIHELVPKDVNYEVVTSRAGHEFQCFSNKAYINITFSPGDGNSILAVRLKDANNGATIKEWQSSNGRIQGEISVDTGRDYIFEYLCAYGTRTITVQNHSYEILET